MNLDSAILRNKWILQSFDQIIKNKHVGNNNTHAAFPYNNCIKFKTQLIHFPYPTFASKSS